jgi:hypothetical protein
MRRKSTFFRLPSRHRMIFTLVENSFSFPFLFIPQATIQSQKPDYGTHIHLISFVKGIETVYITLSPARNEALGTFESKGAFLDIRVVLSH